MPSNPDDIAHLLRRSGFVAPAAGSASSRRSIGRRRWSRCSTPPPTRRRTSPASVFIVEPATGDTTSTSTSSTGGSIGASTTPTPLVEKMTLFWHGHFTTSFSKVYNIPAILSQHRLYRSLALGDFSTLAQRMAVEPAMLWYLDNAENTAGSPNQNFARELMELFLLGVGNYTEDDVVSAARAWTGHTTPEWDVADVRVPCRPPRQRDQDVLRHQPATGTGPRSSPRSSPTPRSARSWPGSSPASCGSSSPIRTRPSRSSMPSPRPSSTRASTSAPPCGRCSTGPSSAATQAKQGLVRSPIEYVVATMHHTGLPARPRPIPSGISRTWARRPSTRRTCRAGARMPTGSTPARPPDGPSSPATCPGSCASGAGGPTSTVAGVDDAIDHGAWPRSASRRSRRRPERRSPTGSTGQRVEPTSGGTSAPTSPTLFLLAPEMSLA